MFFNIKKKPDPKKHDAPSNIIGKGTNIKGDLDAVGNVRLDGKVVGEISSKAKLVLGITAVVEGDIAAQNAEIGGTVKGAVKIAELLTLKASAVVYGDIFTSKLVLEEGAKFNGKCKMGENIHGTQIHHKYDNPDIKDETSIELHKKSPAHLMQQAQSK